MMKIKKARNAQVYLPEYFAGRVAKTFHPERDKDILYWDFSGEICETVKVQIEFLLNQIVKNIKNREERRNQYLLPLKFLLQYAEETKFSELLRMENHHEQEYTSLLKTQTGRLCGSSGKFVRFCRRELFLAEKEPAWQANVWYVDGLNISLERQMKGSVIQSFSFLDILIHENRTAFQEYIKYLFLITNQSAGTIRIQHMYVRELLCYLEGKNMAVSDIDAQIGKKYFNHLKTQNLRPQSYNNKVHGILNFIKYLQIKGLLRHFEMSVTYILKKTYPVRNEIKGLDKKLELLEENLYFFPEDIRIMCVILIYTGIAKGKVLLLKGKDFFWHNEASWMKIPETERSIPIPDAVYWVVIKYMERNQKGMEQYLFLNSKGRRYTTADFCNALMKQCSVHGILDGEYVFKGCDYQKEFCKILYRNGTSIQVIREYMGYATDERVKEYIGWQDERINRASEKYFAQEGQSLGGAVLMKKHDKMNEINRQESQHKIELAIREIKLVSKEGRNISG